MKARVLTFLLFLLHCGVNVANPIFVDSGITYKITSDSTVNVVPANKQESFYQIFKDSILLIPSSVEYGKRFYRVISIEEKAFSTWCGFRSLVISDGIEAIHNRAFAGCTNLRAVAIPKSVKNIGDNPFAYCFNLDSINVNEENALFDSRDGCNAIIRKKDNALLCACKSTESPSSVETIYTDAYRGCLMREIKLPVGLKTIMEYAINDCPNLVRIHIPSSVENIYPRAFSNCYNIESISVDKDNPIYIDARRQTVNGLYAIGSGGLFGVGLGNSKQKQLYIAEPHNDFIFPVVIEELGFVGAALILCLFAYLIYRGYKIAIRCKDYFGSVLVMGIMIQIALQVIINIAVVTDMLPNTGMALPFFSYGGTAIIVLLAEMGIVLSVSRNSSLEKR